MKRLIEIIESGYLNGSGAVLADGTVTSYLAGTSTLQVLYQDFDCQTPHNNPLTLSAEGRATAYTNTRVKLVFKTSGGSTVRTVDNVGTADSDLTSSSASDLAGDGLVASAGVINVNPDGTTLELSSDAVRMKAAGTNKTHFDNTTTSASDECTNLALAATIASNILTVSLKGAAGAAPSSTNPVDIAFRDVTQATGTYSVVRTTAATTLDLGTAVSLGLTTAVSSFFYVYAVNNGGAVELFAAADLYAWDEGLVQTTSTTGTSAAVLYGANARSGKAIRLIGRIKATWTNAVGWSAITNIDLVPFKATPLTQVFTSGKTGFAVDTTDDNFYAGGAAKAGLKAVGDKTLAVQAPSAGTTYPIVTSADPGSSNSLKIVRGTINGSDGATQTGEGFSCVRNGTGDYTLTFSVAFGDAPSVCCAVVQGGAAGEIWITGNPSTTAFTCLTSTAIGGSTAGDRDWNFIAVGLR